MELMEHVCKVAGGRTKGKVTKVTLDDVGWTEEHSDCFETCKRMIGSNALLVHPDPTKRVCVFTDASDLHWGRFFHRCPWTAWINL
jgi:hypothetical protein